MGIQNPSYLTNIQGNTRDNMNYLLIPVRMALIKKTKEELVRVQRRVSCCSAGELRMAAAISEHTHIS